MTKILTTFFSFLLMGTLPLSSADDRTRKKEEIRQELLSIQAALDEMKGGSPEISFPPEREPEPVPAPELKSDGLYPIGDGRSRTRAPGRAIRA